MTLLIICTDDIVSTGKKQVVNLASVQLFLHKSGVPGTGINLIEHNIRVLRNPGTECNDEMWDRLLKNYVDK